MLEDGCSGCSVFVRFGEEESKSMPPRLFPEMGLRGIRFDPVPLIAGAPAVPRTGGQLLMFLRFWAALTT